MVTKLINLLINFGSLKSRLEKIFASPERALFFSIITFSVLGTVLLLFEGLSLLDALFSAMSAVCVTGLEAVPWAQFSDYGKLILMLLVQVGGLGFMTFSFFISWGIFGSSSIGDRHLASELLGFKQISKMRHFLYNIIKFTFLIEFCAALTLSVLFFKMGIPRPIFNAIFLSISGFCNAGICPLDHATFAQVAQNWKAVSILGSVTFLGAIGFPFLHELWAVVKAYFHRCSHRLNFTADTDFKNKNIENLCLVCTTKDARFSINSKVAVVFSVVLIMFCTCVVYLMEMNNNAVTSGGVFNVFFQSIFLRSAGFSILAIEKLAMPTVFFMTFIMLVGGASGSTAGGIKTSTFAVILSSIASLVCKREQVVLFSRTISSEQTKKALTIFVLNMAFIFVTLLLILQVEKRHDFFKVFVECMGAVSTSGFTFGLSKQFCVLGRIIMIFAMIIGRIGVLTFLSIFVSRAQKATFKFPKEKIFIG